MENAIIYELIGYVASVLVAISLMMSNIVRLRVVNLIGAATFSLYGMLIGSVPVAAMNGFIVLINIYYLAQIFGNREYFKILEVDTGSAYLEELLNFYQDQIKTFQPGFKGRWKGADLNIFILRDMVPAGVLIGHMGKAGCLSVNLDFVTPNYRDFKIGHYLFKENTEFFREKGIERVKSSSGSKKHNEYLAEMGFEKSEGEENEYMLHL